MDAISSSKKYKIAVIPGDGIGKEVVPEGISVIEAAGRRFGFSTSWKFFDWSCETYLKTGRMMPEDGIAQLRPFDSIFLGAVGYPGVPDHISLWGLLIPIRREFRQYANVRPVRLLPGIEAAVKNFGPGQIDMCIVRENNEGEYSNIGGRLYSDSEDELAVQQSVFTRRGLIASCATLLKWPKLGDSMSLPQPSPTESSIRCLSGMSVLRQWQSNILEFAPTSSTSISSRHTSCGIPIGSTLSLARICLETSSRI